LCVLTSTSRFAEIKRNTDLPYYQAPVNHELLTCAPFLDNNDLGSCIMFVEEITFVTIADGNAEFTNDDIPFQEDLCIPFDMQLFTHHDEPFLDDIIDHCAYAGLHHDTTPGLMMMILHVTLYDSIIWSPFSTSLWAHYDDIDLKSLIIYSEEEELVSPLVKVPKSTIHGSLARIIEYCHSLSSSAKPTLWQDLVPQQEPATMSNDDLLSLTWSHSRNQQPLLMMTPRL